MLIIRPDRQKAKNAETRDEQVRLRGTYGKLQSRQALLAVGRTAPRLIVTLGIMAGLTLIMCLHNKAIDAAANESCNLVLSALPGKRPSTTEPKSSDEKPSKQPIAKKLPRHHRKH